MEREETAGNTSAKDSPNQRHRFVSVKDSRNRKVRGLWQRNGIYYVQFWVAGETSPRRTRLKATGLDAAKKEMAKVHQDRDQGELPSRGQKPFFDDFAREYIALLKAAAGNQRHAETLHKSAATISKEEGSIRRWIEHFGRVRVDQITRAMIASFAEKRLAQGNTPRTVNLQIIMLRNVLKRALDCGHIRTLPTQSMRPLKVVVPRRGLLTPAEVGALLEASKKSGRNSQMLHDYLRFLTYTGAREKDALRMRWSDTDLTGKFLNLKISKNRETRRIDFNRNLEALLEEMNARRFPDREYLFPSPRSDGKAGHVANFRGAFNIAREKAGLPTIGFHDLRHYFASTCVMNGIDYMTISSWLGHKDGGMLVAKVYGHLADSHKQAAARRLTFAAEEPQSTKP